VLCDVGSFAGARYPRRDEISENILKGLLLRRCDGVAGKEFRSTIDPITTLRAAREIAAALI
jgi:hypothetical protein